MAKARPGLDGDLYRHLGREVRHLREAAELKQEDLAARVGLSRASIANIEAGKQAVPLHLLIAIAQTLDTTIDRLVPSRTASSLPSPEDDVPPEVKAFMRELAAG